MAPYKPRPPRTDRPDRADRADRPERNDRAAPPRTAHTPSASRGERPPQDARGERPRPPSGPRRDDAPRSPRPPQDARGERPRPPSGPRRDDAPRSPPQDARSERPRPPSGPRRDDAPRSPRPPQDARSERPRPPSGPRRDDAPRSPRAPDRPDDGPALGVPRREDEVRVSGFNTALAVFAARPNDIIKVYLTEERIPDAAALLKWCAAEKKAYHVVGAEELGRITESMHHEGICVVAKPRRMRNFGELMEAVRKGRASSCLIALEDVVNPHNVGAIMRVCAHFGVGGVLCIGDTATTLSTSLQRTSEGGSEHVDLVPLMEPRLAISTLKKDGFKILAASQRAKEPMYNQAVPERAVFIFGSESAGISEELASLADGTVRIPGTGAVESLNVACASSAVLSEYWRQHPRNN